MLPSLTTRDVANAPCPIARRRKNAPSPVLSGFFALLLLSLGSTFTGPSAAKAMVVIPTEASAATIEAGAEEESKRQERMVNRRRAKASGDESESDEKKPWIASSQLTGLKARSIGPSLVSGRIVDLAVVPQARHVRYIAVASGGVWKTENAGTTWKPIFDSQGSYSIGCITLDPSDSKVVWVGTGENNSQRSVGWGDGVYRSLDGGTTWKHMGLKESEHIGRIVVDPRDSNVVWVAAQGPLWREGGDRGLYKTTDGGETWDKVLGIDEHTGVSEIWLDPRDPDHAWAVSYQRARRVWTLIDGGPGSGLHETRDGGKTWRKLSNGLPKVELGRIGMAVSPADPDVLYAIVEARSEDAAGVYRSKDGGSNWSRRSGYLSSSPQYYQELVPDPHDPDRVYSLDTYLMVSEDGGATFTRLGQANKHVDEHALYIDPDDTDHLISGNDGGLYESWDRGQTWRFQPNLPITQFYKVAVDNDEPFYNVYGGTQDNNTIGCPSRTRAVYGITNEDCYVTLGGDGFQTRVDPTDPDVVYSQWQHGNLARFDRRTGEIVDIKPMEEPGEEGLRWNWDAPLVLSPHQPTRLYFGAQKLYRSDDRGNSWTRISDDLSRALDRDQLEIMGRLWSIDAVAKHVSTSVYGNLTALTESPLVEGLLYAGTDDGLVQVLDPDAQEGASAGGLPVWRKVETFPGVPELTYVASLEASLHDPDTVYAVFNDHKRGNFAPYVQVSRDRGRTWASITGTDSDSHTGKLDDDDSAWVIEQDHESPGLLFLGTEAGLRVSLDEGAHWTKMTAGLPRIAVRDLDIQRRENDLLIGTFGRGFYIVDDYSPLRALSHELLASEDSALFDPRDSYVYVESDPLGDFLGTSHYRAPNPDFGATFTWFLGEEIKTLTQERRDAEKKTVEAEEAMTFPTWDELRAEEEERAPQVVLFVTDEDGHEVRRLSTAAKKGLHRLTWDLRHPSPQPIGGGNPGGRGGSSEPAGMLVTPGTYRVGAVLLHRGEVIPLADGASHAFEVKTLPGAVFPVSDPAALETLRHEVSRLQRAAIGAQRSLGEVRTRLTALRTALHRTPSATPADLAEIARLEAAERELRRDLEGDALLRGRQVATPPSILGRVYTLVGGLMASTNDATATHERQLEIASADLVGVITRLRALVETDLETFEARLEAAGAPWTPGRLPSYGGLEN